MCLKPCSWAENGEKMFPSDPDIDLGGNVIMGNAWMGGKQTVVLCVSRFPRDLRSCFCCGRSKQQGCVWWKNDRTKPGFFCTFVVLRASVQLILLQLQTAKSNNVKRVNVGFLFKLYGISAQFLVHCCFKTVWDSSFKEVFLTNSSFVRWSTTEGPGKSDNNAVAVCDGQSV